MNAIEEALQENIIETHNGMGDYCAFCRLVIEDNKGHSATCPRALALVEYQKLVTALQWYLHDDETSVEMGILESVDKRPAYIALREVCPTPRAADGAVCDLDHDMLALEGHSTCPNCGAIPLRR